MKLAHLVAFFSFALLFVPLVTVGILSFIGPDGGLSLHWYEKMLESPQLGEALRRSLLVATCASTVATVIGTLGALAIERGKFPGRALLASLTALPLVLPELVLALASVLWFSLLRITLGLHSIVMAHITFTLAYVVVTVRARLADLDPAYEEAARDLGATPSRVFWKVTLPLLLPGVLGGWMMAFTLSFDDFLISFFTAGVNDDTLPMRLYAMIRFGLNKEMYALAATLFAVTAAGLLLHHWTRRQGRGMLTLSTKESP